MAIWSLWGHGASRRAAGWPDPEGFAGRGARLARALGDLDPEPSTTELAALMADQLGVEAPEVEMPCPALQPGQRLCETAALVGPLADGVLAALQDQLYAEWKESGVQTTTPRRGVDWRLVRSWCASNWRLHDRRDALRSYIERGFLPALRERRHGSGRSGFIRI